MRWVATDLPDADGSCTFGTLYKHKPMGLYLTLEPILAYDGFVLMGWGMRSQTDCVCMHACNPTHDCPVWKCLGLCMGLSEQTDPCY